MNAMTQAMQAAGVPLPSVKYRIWHWLKDHAEKTTEDVQKALGLGYAPYQSLLEMERDGIVKVYSDVSRRTSLPGVQMKVKRYSVTNAQEYVAAARKVRTKKKTKPVNPHAKPARDVKTIPGVMYVDEPVPKKQAAPALTEAEEFAAYLEFKAMKKAMKS